MTHRYAKPRVPPSWLNICAFTLDPQLLLPAQPLLCKREVPCRSLLRQIYEGLSANLLVHFWADVEATDV